MMVCRIFFRSLSSNCFFFFLLESVAYEFGANKGMIQYTYPAGRQPDTEEDAISLGFITMKSDAVLLRIESSTTADYMELEIVSFVNTLCLLGYLPVLIFDFI